jgi:hypothetical protein
MNERHQSAPRTSGVWREVCFSRYVKWMEGPEEMEEESVATFDFDRVRTKVHVRCVGQVLCGLGW